MPVVPSVTSWKLGLTDYWATKRTVPWNNLIFFLNYEHASQNLISSKCSGLIEARPKSSEPQVVNEHEILWGQILKQTPLPPQRGILYLNGFFIRSPHLLNRLLSLTSSHWKTNTLPFNLVFPNSQTESFKIIIFKIFMCLRLFLAISDNEYYLVCLWLFTNL